MKKPAAPLWTIQTVRPNSHIIQLAPTGADWTQRVMLVSDQHHDSVHARQDLEIAHLQKALAYNAIIISAGDLFDGMQGKYDPRKSMDAVRPEYQTDKYYDALVEVAEKRYRPYAHLFGVVGYGNHETSVRSKINTDLVQRFVSDLRRNGSQCEVGGYLGWVSFRFTIRKTVRRTKTLLYFHGSGGGGPVTRGAIQTNRMAVNYPDADVVMSGHTHDNWIIPIKRQRIGQSGVPYQDLAYHVRTPTYKDEYDSGVGWAIEKGLNPKPLGCVWLEFYVADNSAGAIGVRVTADIE